jgi:DNA mismatch repair protein MutL
VSRPIRRLAPETASRIAAGEVIERPLSALKELIENALDADARTIEIRVGDSLDRSMTVADDGLGIAPEDLEHALERHATSKITTLDDLDRLTSLGFRGEALPSIAAVSRMRITTRTAGADAAAFVAVAGGTIEARGAAARAPGTTVEVQDLFFNTPARRKFLSRPAGELRSALRLIESYALAFPLVAFRVVIDGRERLSWPAAERVRDRARAIWGAGHADQLIEATDTRDGLGLVALLGLPEHARATREGLTLLVNRRWVQNPMVAQAVRQAYGNLLPAGRFPAATLWLTVAPDRLDVNVHPTKREVRFADDRAVFALVATTCARVLAELHPPFAVVPGGAGRGRWADAVRDRAFEGGATLLGASAGSMIQSLPGLGPSARAAVSDTESATVTASESATMPPVPVVEPELWQLHRTYILAPVRSALVIIDQHAAHERVLYEAARARLQGIRGTSQQLLFPVLVDLSASQYDQLLEIGPWLQQLGWNLSLLGPPTAVIHGTPAEVRREDPGAFLVALLEGVSEDAARSPADDIAERLARVHACHAAVKAGDALSPVEMRTLVDQLFATELPHGDPHGRVTYVRLELAELHRRFGRA